MGEVAHHESQFDELARKPTEEYLRRTLAGFPDKPMIVSEFGTRGILAVHGDVDYSADFQAAYIKAIWKVITSFDDLSAEVPWCWADYYHRREPHPLRAVRPVRRGHGGSPGKTGPPRPHRDVRR